MKWVEKNHHLAYWFILYFPGCTSSHASQGGRWFRFHIFVGGSARWLSHHVDLDETLPAGSVLYIRMFPKIVAPQSIHFSRVFGFSIINHPFRGILIFGNTHIRDYTTCYYPLLLGIRFYAVFFRIPMNPSTV